jgi:hypothetical protein
MATQGNRFREDEMKPRIIHQVAADVFPVLTLLLYPSDFSFRMPVRRPAPTFLIFSLIGVPVRRQAIDLPSPGIRTSNLLSKSQISFVTRGSELCGGEGGMGVGDTFDCSGKLKVVGTSTFTCSTVRGKSVVVSSTRSEFPSMPSLPEATDTSSGCEGLGLPRECKNYSSQHYRKRNLTFKTITSTSSFFKLNKSITSRKHLAGLTRGRITLQLMTGSSCTSKIIYLLNT